MAQYIVEEVAFINGVKSQKPKIYTAGNTLEEANKLLINCRNKKIAVIKSNSSYDFLYYTIAQNRCFVDYIEKTAKSNGDHIRIEFNIAMECHVH